MATKQRGRRIRTHGDGPGAGASSAPLQSVPVTVPLPPWQWKTFPVYFALASGIFVGSYAGFIVGAIGSEFASLALFVTVAIIFGFGLSRFTTRWMMAHNWVRPRAARKKR